MRRARRWFGGLTAVAVVAMGARSRAITAEPSPAAGGANRAERPDAIQVAPEARARGPSPDGKRTFASAHQVRPSP
jgi:hypothetical protein